MVSYNVYFSPRDGTPVEELIAQVHRFMATQVAGNRAVAYRILKMNNKTSFSELPDFHLIVDYESEEDLKAAFGKMSGEYTKKPHSPLMSMVGDFKVSFSVDETVQPAEPIS
ncbi:MAG: hypothetical protein AAFX93_02415 [Verrucomicrobiota bacterium]